MGDVESNYDKSAADQQERRPAKEGRSDRSVIADILKSLEDPEKKESEDGRLVTNFFDRIQAINNARSKEKETDGSEIKDYGNPTNEVIPPDGLEFRANCIAKEGEKICNDEMANLKRAKL
jgi:hypothetical protein